MMSKLAKAAKACRPAQVAFHQAWGELVVEHMRVQVDAMNKTVTQYQGEGRKTQEVFEWATSMEVVLAEFKKRLIEDGHWGRLQTELGIYGENRNIVLHAACNKGDLQPCNLMVRYLAHTDDKKATAVLACKEYAALLSDLNGFVCLTARNDDQMLAVHPIVLVSFAAILCV
jgi:hypothetical protein